MPRRLFLPASHIQAFPIPCGRAGKGFVLGACRQGICFIPLIFVLPVFMGENGIFYAQPVADVFAAGAALFAAVEFRKELNYRWKGEREE